MAILPILTGKDHPKLRAKAKPIAKVTKEIKALAKDMIATMEAAEGVGLAAPQIGESVRLCIVPIAGRMTALVNPKITSKSKEKYIDQEGCLSLPGIWMDVERSVSITLAYTDISGKKQERKLEKFAARVTQHEVDHLDGVLIVDYVKNKAL